jgi:spermidine/putrescine transport system permease protein
MIDAAKASHVRQLIPATAYYVVFFAASLLILLVYSFWTQVRFEIVPGFTLANYVDSVASPVIRAILIRTVVVGFVTAAIVVPIAYLLAYVMRFVFTTRGRLLLDIILISMFSGYLVRIYAWRTILGRNGLLNGALLEMGLIDEPITFLIFSNWAILITLVGLLIPLALLPIYSSMSNVSKAHLEVARDLGSTTLNLHRTILLPMVLPGVSVAFAISFILAAGDFVVPSMVGGTEGVMVGNLVSEKFKGLSHDWPLGSALTFIIMSLVVAVYLLTTRTVKALTRL